MIKDTRLGFLIFACGMAMVGFCRADGLTYPHQFEPDPERFSEEVHRLVASDSELMPPVGAVVCTGSSSMRMWHGRIEEDLAGITVIPRGFGGSHFSDLIHYADTLILKYRPRAVVIYEGDNDSADGKSPERIRGDLEYLVAYCRQEIEGLRFYVISIKPSVLRSRIWPVAQEANTAMAEYCAETDGVTFIDVSAGMLREDGSVRDDIFLEDRLHLNDLGYDIWTAAIAPVVVAGESTFE